MPQHAVGDVRRRLPEAADRRVAHHLRQLAEQRAIARAVDWARAGDARGTLARVMPVAVEVELAARDYDKAIAIARESLAFGEETAPDRPGTAWSRALLGHALVLSGDAAAGKPLLEAATAALSRELGPEHSRSRSAQAWLLDAD